MDVSGFWTGEYAYDSVKGLKVEFKAGLAQTGAILSGDTTEENTFADQCGQILIAELFGKVSGQNVSFTKAYKNGPPGQEKILYQGSISDDGSLITGTWTIMSSWTGSFRMTREIEQPPRKGIVTANDTIDA